MAQETRHEMIVELLNSNGQVTVQSIAKQFAITEQTARRDLANLCSKGLATRVHGGVKRLTSNASSDYETRRLKNIAAKSRIGRKAAQIIPNGSTVAINIGTTTEQVANALINHHDLQIITNNTNIVGIMRSAKLKSLIQVGGQIRPSDGAVVGEEAVEFISRYKADYAIVGASSIDEDGSILDFDPREVAVARAILKNARTKILVIDNSKFSVDAPVRIADLSDIHYVVLDTAPSPTFSRAAENAGAKIVVAGS